MMVVFFPRLRVSVIRKVRCIFRRVCIGISERPDAEKKRFVESSEIKGEKCITWEWSY